MRSILSEDKISTAARVKIDGFHAEIVDEVKSAIAAHEIVLVGMAGNPFVKRARKLLDEKTLPYKYLEYGSYLSKWQERLAIKLWSGWSSYPQVFIAGKLIGGYSDLVQHLNAKKN